MREARLGDVVASMKNGIYKPATEYADDGMPCLRMYNIDAGAIVWRDIKRMRINDREFTDYGLHEGDLLVNRVNSRELVGKAAYIPASLEPSVFESKNIRLRLDRTKALPKFINYQLFARGSRHFANNAQQVVGMASISQGQLADFPIVLTGLDEQRSVVAEIEKQFSRLDEAVANLQRVKANLKRYKAAVLTAAVSGNLVEIEAKRPTIIAEPAVSGVRIAQGRKSNTKRGREASSLGLLPEGWIWAEAADLASPEPNSICAGPFGTIFKAKDFRSAGVPIIFLRHVAPLRYLDRKPGFMDTGKWEELFKPYSAYGGELLITKLGEPPGVCAMYPHGIGPAMVTPDVIKMNVDPSIASSTYVMYYFNSEIAKRFATGAAFGTTRTRLTLPLFREMPVALPPLAEQHRIVAEVDRRLSITREVETEVDANLKRAATLRAAVLDRAFAPGCPDSYSKD